MIEFNMTDDSEPAVTPQKDGAKGGDQEMSLEEAAELFRSSISDEVDKPKDKPAKDKAAKDSGAKDKAAKAEPPKGEDESDEDEDDESASDEEDEEDEDEEERDFDADRMRLIAKRQREVIDSAEKEISRLKEELAKASALVDATHESLYDDDVLSSLSIKEREELAAYIYYTIHEDKADGEVKSLIEGKRGQARIKRLERETSKKEKEIAERQAAAESELERGRYQTSVRECVIDMADEIPSLMDLYDGDRKKVSEAVFKYAVEMAKSGTAKSDDEISPENIIKLLEKETSRMYEKRSAKKVIKSTSKMKRKVAPSNEMTREEEAEYLGRLFRGER